MNNFAEQLGTECTFKYTRIDVDDAEEKKRVKKYMRWDFFLLLMMNIEFKYFYDMKIFTVIMNILDKGNYAASLCLKGIRRKKWYKNGNKGRRWQWWRENRNIENVTNVYILRVITSQLRFAIKKR